MPHALEIDPAQPAHTNPLDGLVRAEQREELRYCVAQLRPRLRLIFQLVRVEGIRQCDVAAQLGVSRPRVAQLLAAADGEVRNCLTSQGVMEQ